MKRVLEVVAVIFVLAVLRIVMVIPNFHPIGVMAIFGGAMLANKKIAIALPLTALLIGDLILAGTMGDWYATYLGSWSMFFVYISVIGMVLISNNLIAGKPTFGKVLATGIFSSALFFVITNLGAWIYDPFNLYPDGISGAIASLAAGLPFATYEVVSTIGGSLVLFGAYELYSRMVTKKLVADRAND